MFGGRLSLCGREQVESGILRVSEGYGPFCGYLSPSTEAAFWTLWRRLTLDVEAQLGPDRRRILGDRSDSSLVSHEYRLLVLVPVDTCQSPRNVVPAGALDGSKLGAMCELVHGVKVDAKDFGVILEWKRFPK